MRIDEVAKPPTWVRLSALSGDNKVDPITPLELKLDNASKPLPEEPAMTHPFNTSMIKIRNNGMIDAFVGTDQGIRLDPNTKSVNIITDSLKEHLNIYRAWVQNDWQAIVKKAIIFKSDESSFNVTAKTDINNTAGKDINSKAEKNFNVQAGGDITMKAGKNINLTAGGIVDIKGGTINIKGNGNVTITGGGTTIVQGGTTIVKGGTVRIN